MNGYLFLKEVVFAWRKLMKISNHFTSCPNTSHQFASLPTALCVLHWKPWDSWRQVSQLPSWCVYTGDHPSNTPEGLQEGR